MLQDMSYDAFVEEVIRQLPEYLPPELRNITIESSSSLCNNNICRKELGLSSANGKDENKKFLNLMGFYRSYQDKYSMEGIMCRIAQSVTEICLSDFPAALVEKKYENAKKYLMVGICNEEANMRRLRNAPCEKRGDLALIYLLRIKTGDFVWSTIMINNIHLKEWSIT